MKFLTKLKFAWAFWVSLQYDSKKKYQKVIDTLEKYRFFVDSEIYNLFPEFYILLGVAFYKITNYKVAEGYLLKALNVNKRSDKLNQDEVSYLNLHIYYWLHLTYKHLYDEVKASQCSKLFKSITYNEENVRNSIKGNLPFNEL